MTKIAQILGEREWELNASKILHYMLSSTYHLHIDYNEFKKVYSTINLKTTTRKQNKMAGISQNRNEMAKIWHIILLQDNLRLD